MPKMYPEQPSQVTNHLNRHSAENICHAIDYAKYLNRPLNLYVVLNLNEAAAGLTATKIFEKVRHKYRDWNNYRQKQAADAAEPPYYVYTHERPDDQHPHVNWMVHIPANLHDEFIKKLVGWLRKAQGVVGNFDIDVQLVDPTTDKTLAKYIIKGTDERYVPYLHLEQYAQPQGIVWGRRGTASPALGRKARKGAGFVPKRDRNKWKSRHPNKPTRSATELPLWVPEAINDAPRPTMSG